MALCMNCSSQTNYMCLSCSKAICNKSAKCSVPANEETAGWKMGVSVAHCLVCLQKNQGSDRDDQGSSPKPLVKVTKSPPGSGYKAKISSTSSTEASGSRKCLTLKEKIEVIQLSGKGGISTRKLVSRFGCGKTQIMKVLKNKEKIMSGWNCNEKSAMQKRWKVEASEICCQSN